MKIIFTADLHFSLYSQDTIIEGIPRRLYYLIKILTDICQYAIKNKIFNIGIAGDTLHNKSIIHAVAFGMLLDLIRRFPEITFYIIDGNHDVSSKSGDGVSALKGFDNEPNVIMIHTETQIQNIAFIPWNPKTMKQEIKNSKADYLVSHFGLNEAMLNSGISIVSDIGLRDLKHFKRCFIGHYHTPQEVGNVIIPGSIIQLDWGEKGENKRFVIFDSDTNEVEFVEIEGYQKHIEVEINENNLSEVLKAAKKYRKEGHFVKLLKVENVDTSEIEKDFHIVDKTVKDITNRGIDSSMSLEDKLEAYLKIKNIPLNKHGEYILEAKKIIDAIA